MSRTRLYQARFPAGSQINVQTVQGLQLTGTVEEIKDDAGVLVLCAFLNGTMARHHITVAHIVDIWTHYTA